eukprot:6021463-Prymnesium_polylepis.1
MHLGEITAALAQRPRTAPDSARGAAAAAKGGQHSSHLDKEIAALQQRLASRLRFGEGAASELERRGTTAEDVGARAQGLYSSMVKQRCAARAGGPSTSPSHTTIPCGARSFPHQPGTRPRYTAHTTRPPPRAHTTRTPHPPLRTRRRSSC